MEFILRGFGVLLLLCISIIFADENIKVNTDNPIAVTEEGFLVGKFNVSRNGREYSEFLGVRYAENPNRFQIADSVLPWKGIRNATEFGSRCPYYRSNAIFGEEDCLFLNVYTPQLPPENRKLFPVMVFFHEGGFLYGSAENYGPQYFMDESVVIVTINYRLSLLGFLSTEDEEAPGNMGLKDQVRALEWVQRNIKHFSGDPNKVTIFGYSAGGASVTYHLLSEMSKGLFHRAIAQAGSALNPWAFAPQPLENAKILAKTLNCSTTNTKEMVACLQKTNLLDILKYQRSPFVKWYYAPLYVFVPSVEKKIGDGVMNFLLQKPREILNSGKIPNNVPLMTGSVREDGIVLMGADIANDETRSKEMNANWSSVAPIAFFYEDSAEQNQISDKIREKYFKPNQSIGAESVVELSNIFSDRWFLKGIKDFSRAYSRITNNSVFNYVVTYELPSPYKSCTKYPQTCHTKFGVTHGDDVPLFFEQSWNRIPQHSEYYSISNIYLKLWVNFANTGNPDGVKETGTIWNKSNPEETPMQWFHINKEFKMAPAEFMVRADFWNSVSVSQ